MAEIWNLNEICRCCHKDGYYRSMQYPYVSKDGHMEVYSSLMKEVFGIVMVTPSVKASEMICEDCITSLRDARKFRKQVIDCELWFQQYCRNEAIVKSEQDDAHSELKLKIIEECDFTCIGPSKKHEDKTELNIETHKDHETIDICDNTDSSDNMDHNDNIDHLDNDNMDHLDNDSMDHLDNDNMDHLDNDKMDHLDNDNMDHLDNDNMDENYDDSDSVPVVSETLAKKDDYKKVMKKVTTTKTIKRKVTNCNKLDNDSETPIKKRVETKDKKNLSKVKTKASKRAKTGKRKYIKKVVNTGGKQRLPDIKCQFCDETVKGGVPKYKRHIKAMHPGKGTVCNYCPEIFLYRANLKLHYQNGHKNKERYTCDVCQKTFYNKTVIRHHIQRLHTNHIMYTCHICGHQFSTQSNMNKHILEVHENIRPYKCEFCPKTFKTKSHLTTHTRSMHTFERPFACDICGKRFILYNDLTKHNSSTHPEGKNDEKYNKIIKEDGTTEDVPNSNRIYRCYLCKEIQSGRRSYRKHLDNKHNGILPYQCHICTKSFSSNFILNRHIETHSEIITNQVQCDRCSKFFKLKPNLINHMKRVHLKDDNNMRVTKEGYVRCEICRNLIKEKIIEKHMDVHLKRPFKCDQCEKDYSSHSTLKRHVKEAHLKLYNNECDICHLRFIKKKTVGKHKLKKHPEVFQNEMKMEDDTLDLQSFLTSKSQPM